MDEQNEHPDGRESVHCKTVQSRSDSLEKFRSSSYNRLSEANSVGELVEEKGERQNAKEREQEDGGQSEPDLEIVQQIEKRDRILLFDSLKHHWVLHPDGHTLRQPLLVQVVRLSTQVQIGLLRLDPLKIAIS